MTTKIKLTPARIQAAACPSDKADTTLWDADTLGLGLRVYRGGQKSWWFQFRIDGKAARIRVGDADPIKGWPIGQARDEARRLRVLVDQGKDPRQERTDKAKARVERRAQEAAEAITLGEAWATYIDEFSHAWSEGHLKDHHKMMVEPGLPRPRSKLNTVAGPLWSLRNERLVDLPAKIPGWALEEAKHRPTVTKKALVLLKTLLKMHDVQLKDAIGAKAAKKLQTALPKPHVRKVSLRVEQLPGWWAGTLLLPPSTSAYLRFQLLTGCRPTEGATLEWANVNQKWKTLTIRDKVKGQRTIPLTPYVQKMLLELRAYGRVIDINREERDYTPVAGAPSEEQPSYVFRAMTGLGHLTNADKGHNKVLAFAGISKEMNLHGLRKTFLTLWDSAELPLRAGEQIAGHAPSSVAERHYIDRDQTKLLELMTRYERWILDKAGVETESPAITNRTRKNLIALK